MANENDWFAPKRFGYGSGLPIRWQGWALVFGFSAALIGAAICLLPAHELLFTVITLIAAVVLTLISAQHTRGGWKWRWGDDD